MQCRIIVRIFLLIVEAFYYLERGYTKLKTMYSYNTWPYQIRIGGIIYKSGSITLDRLEFAGI